MVPNSSGVALYSASLLKVSGGPTRPMSEKCWKGKPNIAVRSVDPAFTNMFSCTSRLSIDRGSVE